MIDRLASLPCFPTLVICLCLGAVVMAGFFETPPGMLP